MWDEKQMEEYLKRNLKESRYLHSLSVRDTAEYLAQKYDSDINKARIAGLVHDCAKNMSDKELIRICKKEGYSIDEICESSPQLLHGYVGSIIAHDKMGINDEDILNAIAYHTTGRKHMSLLEKIIYIADYIEPFRIFPGVQLLRETTERNLEEALLLSFDNTIKFVISKGGLIHKDTIEARNFVISQK
ncbi:MAG: bis(5'-nucleosyl)-tetraphosphatase (symmetrical) YqeK [Bacillota bacterium]|nr:bis(5'-nucleosyl)-tetraphosphatase (symmetrical) YqeK [Bacillota bacterium]